MTVVCSSYRDSHLTKGMDYHSNFQQNPRRKLLWDIERGILDQIFKHHFSGRQVEHLDFACGTGRILAFMQPRVSSSTGVDVSTAMLEVARAATPNAQIIHADLTRESALGDRKFDLITAFRFFSNAEPKLRTAALRALARVLKPDGILVFNNHRSRRCLRNCLVRLLTLGRKGNGGMSHDEVKQLVDEAGLQIDGIFHLGIVPEYERHLLRPRSLVTAIEKCGSKLPLRSLAENHVFVCRVAASNSE